CTCFFFQAEDGIRDDLVTGVQTCALPIYIAARVLDITLTSREMGRGERVAMAGIPAHSADGYIARLIAAGLHVAIAEQIGTVARNGIVPREIVRVLTPGTLLESDLLSGTRANFLLSLVRD